MSTFQVSDKVICIDATPIPIGAPGMSVMDFKFPAGYIREDVVYCVKEVWRTSDGGQALMLTGPCAVLKGEAIPWNGQRFRKTKHNKDKHYRSAESPHPQDDIPF